jgi:hypothetical protein
MSDRLVHTQPAAGSPLLRSYPQLRLYRSLIGVKPELQQISRSEQHGQNYESSGNDTPYTPRLPPLVGPLPSLAIPATLQISV